MQHTGMQGSSPGAAPRQGENVAEQAHTGLGQLTDAAQQTIERITQAASRLGERSDELWALQDRALKTARTYVREHPIATIGIALAVGLLISRLTSRR